MYFDVIDARATGRWRRSESVWNVTVICFVGVDVMALVGLVVMWYELMVSDWAVILMVAFSKVRARRSR